MIYPTGMNKTLAVLTLAAVTLLTGCSMMAAHPTPTPTKHTPKATYATVAELKEAFVRAGGSCPTWVESDRVTVAAQSGECSDDTVLSIYTSQADRDEVVANLRAFSDQVGMNVLVGKNWLINTPNPDQYVSDLGGTAVTK